MTLELLASQLRLTLWPVVEIPLPVTASAIGEFEALLTKEMLPDAVPEL